MASYTSGQACFQQQIALVARHIIYMFYRTFHRDNIIIAVISAHTNLRLQIESFEFSLTMARLSRKKHTHGRTHFYTCNRCEYSDEC